MATPPHSKPQGDQERFMKSKLISTLIFAQLVLSNSTSWADDGPDIGKPRISDVGGVDHSPGVTLVIFATLVLIGFGVGFIVGRKTRRN